MAGTKACGAVWGGKAASIITQGRLLYDSVKRTGRRERPYQEGGKKRFALMKKVLYFSNI